MKKSNVIINSYEAMWNEVLVFLKDSQFSGGQVFNADRSDLEKKFIRDDYFQCLHRNTLEV